MKSLLVLLQATTVVTPDSVAWRTTDVIYVIAGVLSVASGWFLLQSKVQALDERRINCEAGISSRIDQEVMKSDEKRAVIKREFEIHVDKHKALEKRIDQVEKNFVDLENGLAKEVKILTQSIHELSMSIEKMKSEILTQIITKKRR